MTLVLCLVVAAVRTSVWTYFEEFSVLDNRIEGLSYIDIENESEAPVVD